MRDNLIEIPTKSARMCGIFFASFCKTAVYTYTENLKCHDKRVRSLRSLNYSILSSELPLHATIIACLAASRPSKHWLTTLAQASGGSRIFERGVQLV